MRCHIKHPQWLPQSVTTDRKYFKKGFLLKVQIAILKKLLGHWQQNTILQTACKLIHLHISFQNQQIYYTKKQQTKRYTEEKGFGAVYLEKQFSSLGILDNTLMSDKRQG